MEFSKVRFTIKFSSRSRKEFENLDKIYKNKVVECLKTLSLDPVPVRKYDTKKLSGLKDSFRIRIGKVRIVYTVLWEEKVVLIARIGFRESVYQG